MNKILLIHVSGRIGDSLLATPAISSIQKKFNNLSIDLLVHRNTLELFENIPGVTLLGSISEKRAWYKGWFQNNKYDYVIVFNLGNSLENIVKFALRVGNKVIASNTGKFKIDSNLYASINRLNTEHHVMAYLNYLTPFKIKNPDVRLKFHLTRYEINFAEDLLRKLVRDEKKFLIGYKFSSLASRSYRDWPIESFIALSKKIIKERPSAFFIIFGGTDEREKINIFVKSFSRNICLDLSGLTIRKTAAVMSLLKLYVGVDTGPSHLMGSFNLPMALLFHGKSPSKYYAPLNHPNCEIIDHPLGDRCSENDSMDAILVYSVFKKIKKYL
jgi:heptosyltransferase-3